MQPYIDQLIRDGYFAGMPKEVVYAVAMVLARIYRTLRFRCTAGGSDKLARAACMGQNAVPCRPQSGWTPGDSSVVSGRHQEFAQGRPDTLCGRRKAFFARTLCRLHGISLRLRGHSFRQRSSSSPTSISAFSIFWR